MNRTVRDFQNALESLLRKHPFEKLTVDQICEEALLHRSSFYRYFHDKYDLLEHLINTRLNKMLEEASSEDDLVVTIIHYADDNRDIFRHLALDGTNSTLYIELVRILSDTMLKEMKNEKVHSAMSQALRKSSNPELLSYTYGGALMGICYWWQMKNYDVPVQEVIDFARQTLSNDLNVSKDTK